MEIKDKRLVDRMNVVEQEKYYKELSRIIPDAQDCYEEIEIDHDPICLLKKTTSKISENPESPFTLEKSDED